MFPFSALNRVSTRMRLCVSHLITLFLLVTAAFGDQGWPLPEEVAASLIHEIPVLHTAFVQIGEELHYLNQPIRTSSEGVVQNIPVFESIEGNGENGRKTDKIGSFNVLKLAGKGEMPLEMDPPMLDFGQNSVGNAQTRKIFFRNMRNEEIFLDAVAVNSVEFQASYFENFSLKPHQVTTLEIVFLPREIGKRSTTVHFYTSAGTFTYKVQGNCVSNPYRISPFSGYRLPMNSSVSKPIILFNPHPYPMRITEIGTSGGNGHVDLPHEVDANLANEPPQYWDIRPFQSKHVATVVLVGGMAENSTVFVRIAAELHLENNSKEILDDIYMTIPIEVVKKRGVYTFDEVLDFGLVRQGVKSEAKYFSVAQYQIGGRLEFETLYVDRGDHTPLYMEFTATPPIVIYPANKGSVTLGPKVDLVKVHIEGGNVNMSPNEYIRQVTGNIIAVSRGGNYNISMPYRAEVFRGELSVIGNDLSIQEDLRPPHQRVIRVENKLPFDVAIWNISLAADLVPHFSVRLVDRTVLIKTGHVAPIFVLKYNKKVPQTLQNSTIFVHTNVSTFSLPVYTYNGKMTIELTSVDKTAFDFGYVQRNDTRTIRFVVWNENHAELRLKNLAIPHRNAYRLYEVGTKSKGNFTDVRNDERLEYVEPTDVDIPAHQGKIFDLELKVPFDGVVEEGQVLFETDWESRLFAMTYQVSGGSLQSFPDEVSFGQTFPTRMVYRTLQVFNSFTEDMIVTRLTTINEDPRFFFEGFDPKNPPILKSGRLTNLGRIIFNPAAPCEHDYCYLGIPLGSSDGAWFIHGLSLPSTLPEIDLYLYKNLRKKFDALVKSGKHHVNTTIILDTDKAKNIKIKTSAELVWPRLLTRNSIQFPLTALGNFTIVNLTLANPTQMPIAIQVIPLVIYPQAEDLVEVMRPHLVSELTEHVEMNETLMFSLRDTELFTLKPESPVPKLREAFEAHLNNDFDRYNGGINIPRFTLSMILRPNTKVRLRLGFLPSDYTLRSSLLLIRNNLTGIEPVVMYGKGARIGVKVEGVEARSKKPLLFEIRHDHLSDCNNPRRLLHKLHSTLTVRRPFQVTNTGEVQFIVTNMSINGIPCENRGFKILNCYPFRLQPNESYGVEVAYTPDFLTTTNEADLQLFMHMNGSAWVFPLAATVPVDMLAKCHQALPRPPFESIMYYSCVTALIFCLVCVLACAYLEGDRAIACAIRQQFAVPRHVFDLNNLKPSTSSTTSSGVTSSTTNASATPSASSGAAPAAPRASAPSTLRVGSDAWAISKYFVRLANWIVHKVHLVWRWSLFYRKEKPTSSEKTSAGKKPPKKKTPVAGPAAAPPTRIPSERVEEFRQMLEMLENGNENGRFLEMEEELAEMFAATRKASGATGVNAPEQVETVPTVSKNQKKKKSKQNNNVVVVAAAPPTPPQPAPVQNRNQKTSKPKPEAPKKPIPETPRTTKAPETSKASPPKPTTSNPPNPPAPSVPPTVSPPPPPPSQQPAPVPQADFQPFPAYTDPSLLLPDTGFFYRQFLASFGNPTENTPWDWDSPAAQAAMPFMNLWNTGGALSVEQMEELIRQASSTEDSYGGVGIMTNTTTTTTPSEAVPEIPEIPEWNGRNGLEDTLETDEMAPDWADEDVNASDAEMDFSSMAAASRDIFHEDENEMGRRRRSPSIASSTLSRRLENSPQKMGSRRLTIGSEKKRNEEFSRTPGAPPTSSASASASSRLLPDLQPSSFATSSMWGEPTSSGGLLNPWGAVTTSSGIPTSSEVTQENDPLSLSHLGINLDAPLFGTNTMFSGPEFNLWSSGSIFQPPQPQEPSSSENVRNSEEKN